MNCNGYYLVDESTNELWLVEYSSPEYTTLDIPIVRRSKLTYEDVVALGHEVKTFKEIVSLLPYPDTK